MSTIEQDVWTSIDDHFTVKYWDNELWNTVIAPYMEKFVSAEASTREKIECMDELINHLYSFYLDSKSYCFIPDELRRFLESSGETTILLGYRLTESVRSLEKMRNLREVLRGYVMQSRRRKEIHELNELLEAIEMIINSDG